MKQLIFNRLIYLLILFSSFASSDSTDPTQLKMMTFEALDVDQDGVISYSEAKALPQLATDFDETDIDKNKKIDRDEFQAFIDKNA